MARAFVSTALALALLAPVTASAAPYTAPGRKVLWGGQGGYDARHISLFEQQSGKHPAVFNYFISWKASESSFHWLGFRLDDAERQGAHAMLSVSTDNPALSPRLLARGGGDRLLVGLNHLLAEHGNVVYLRPLSEMNNANNPYSAYDQSGRLRGEAFKPSWFKKAWRLLDLIVRGGGLPTGNAKLTPLALPPVKTDSLARPPVALMWVPLSYGNPETKANH